MYQTLFTRRAGHTRRHMPGNRAKLSGQKLEPIAADPYAKHNNATKLQRRPGYHVDPATICGPVTGASFTCHKRDLI